MKVEAELRWEKEGRDSWILVARKVGKQKLLNGPDIAFIDPSWTGSGFDWELIEGESGFVKGKSGSAKSIREAKAAVAAALGIGRSNVR